MSMMTRPARADRAQAHICWILALFTSIGLANTSAYAQADTLTTDTAAIRAVVEGIIAADNVENLERVLGYYTSDAVLIAPEGPDVIGANAIRKHYQSLFAAVDLDIQARIDDIAIAADLAVVRGLNTVFAIAVDSQQKSCTESKYLMSLRRSGGEWKISQLMWSNQLIPC